MIDSKINYNNSFFDLKIWGRERDNKMSTAFTRERDAKRAAKEAKKKADKEEKERVQQAKVVEEFNEKQT